MLTPHLGSGPRRVTHRGWGSRAWDPQLLAPVQACVIPGRSCPSQRRPAHPTPCALGLPDLTGPHSAARHPVVLCLPFNLLFRKKNFLVSTNQTLSYGLEQGLWAPQASESHKRGVSSRVGCIRAPWRGNQANRLWNPFLNLSFESQPCWASVS